MKDLVKVRKIFKLATELILLKDTLDQDEREFIEAYLNYSSSKKIYSQILKKFEEG